MTRQGVLQMPLICDPTVTALNRLPMRGTGVFTDQADQARAKLSDRTATDDWSVDLDGTWDFLLVARPQDVSVEMVAETTDRKSVAGGGSPLDWSKIAVPGAWTLQGPDVSGDGHRSFEPPHYTNVVMPFREDPPGFPDANPTGVYRRKISVPRGWKGRRTILRVGAAESVSQVFVNGEFVGGGTDSRLPSEFDLTDFVTPGRRADLAIVVTKWSAHTWVEDQDQWWHGGIQRSISLHSVPTSSFAQVKLLPGLDDADGTLSLETRLVGPVVREPGWTVELSVEARTKANRTPRTLASTGQLDVPVWDDTSEAASLLSGMFVEPGVVRADLRIAEIAPWSHEQPNLYRSLLVLRDPQSRVVQVHASLTGFRSVRIAGNELLINDRPILLHGVNIHEHSPETGRAVTAEQTRADLELMKAHNLNAVRAAHYPHDEHLAELCDELGLYLVDEANVESHGRQTSLCHDPRFMHTMVERVQRMAERDQHHPSVIIWSLGNESGYGAPHDAAAAWLRRYDPTRPVQYEGPFMHDLYAEAPVSDVVCPMYSSIEDITAWAKAGRDDRRPLILCEYSHAMGNSNGSLSDYWHAFETTPGLQGGFIWEWVDHGLKLFGPDGELLRGPVGTPSWGYGGDFGDTPNDSNFVCDGLVSADRVPGPAMAEVHHLGRPVVARLAHRVGQGRPKLAIRNRRWFTDTSDLRTTWELVVDGDVVGFGDLEVQPIAARSEVVVALPFRPKALANVDAGAEVHLNLIFALRRRNDWASGGHVVGIEQLAIPRGEVDPADESGRTLDAPATESASGGAKSAASTQARGASESAGSPVDLAAIPWRPTVFRALTDNDGLRQGWMRGLVGNLARWVDDQGLDRTEWNPGRERVRVLDPPHGDMTEVVQSGELVAGNGSVVKVRRALSQMSDRWTRLDAEMRLPSELADVPRVGFEFELSDGAPWTNVEWFGDGPHETYSDRRAASRVGRWRTSIDEMYQDHAVPQEYGHRTGLRWVALTRAGSGRRREGLLIVAETQDQGRRPGFSVRRHSDGELWSALHSHDLTPSQAASTTYLYLDIAQRGVGTESCGPDTLEEYRIRPGRHRLRVWICGFDPRSEDPGVLARTLR